MRSIFFLAGLLVILVMGAGHMAADPADSATSAQASPISFLSSVDQQKFIIARSKMLANHPELEAEAEDLKRQADALREAGGGTPEQRAGLTNQIVAYQQSIRSAMLKEDPTLGPILSQIDQHLAQARNQPAASSMTLPPQLPSPPKATNALITPGMPAPTPPTDAPSTP